jgi:hypothetical protein
MATQQNLATEIVHVETDIKQCLLLFILEVSPTHPVGVNEELQIEALNLFIISMAIVSVGF